MAAIDSPSLLLISLLCHILVLTSAVIAITEPDGTSPALTVPKQESPQKLSSSIPEHSVTDTKASKNVTNMSVMAEGGPITMSKTTQRVNIEDITGFNIIENSRTRENVPKERNASPSVVARKGVEEKIKPRKGVEQSRLEPEQNHILFNQTTFEKYKPVVETLPMIESIHGNNQSNIFNLNTLKLNVTDLHSNDNIYHNTNSSKNLIPINITSTVIKTTNNATLNTTVHVQKHKPKPTVTTVNGPEVSEVRTPLKTKSPSLGMPRKIDYIIPVIITIIALPLLGVAIFVLYRRGRDCWDKRHYRRMDFLIDGMYND